MATEMRPAVKFIPIFLIVALLFGGAYYWNKSSGGALSSKLAPKSKSGVVPKGIFGGSKKDDGVIKVGVVTWGGYAGGQYFNGGFAASEASRYFKEYGIKVQFILLDDFDASRAAWKANEVNLLWSTIDAFPTEVGGLAEYNPKVVFQADWSRGGDAIVVKSGINTANDLLGKKIAVAFGTPSHTFLLYMLDASGLSSTDVEIISVKSAVDAANMFRSNGCDAAVVWAPDDEDCVTQVQGAKILMNTKKAQYIIADIFYAKAEWIASHQKELNALVEGWMIGAGEINSSDVAKRKAASILAAGLGQPEDFCYNAINNTRLCTAGDNRRFFGITSWTGVTGERLYNKMTKVYRAINFITGQVPAFDAVVNTSAILALSPDLANQAPEGEVTYRAADAVKAKVVATKSVTINFASGSAVLEVNARTVIDFKIVDLIQMSTNMLRIEGNTDNVGSEAMNVQLSKKRAQAIASYLTTKYQVPASRIQSVGNGPNKPVGDNTTEEGREKNRRVDVILLD